MRIVPNTVLFTNMKQLQRRAQESCESYHSVRQLTSISDKTRLDQYMSDFNGEQFVDIIIQIQICAQTSLANIRMQT